MPFSARTDPTPLRPTAVELCLLGAFAVSMLVYWWLLGVPRTVPEVRVERVDCVSYAPFRLPGETPFDRSLRVTRERIQVDLKLLKAKTGCVRTYSVDQGLDQVPSVARELGMHVLLGAWLGRDRERNAVELGRAIELAQAEAATVRALIVGNEVLLRGEMSEAELADLIGQAKRALDVPVTYADVWEFWLRHPKLADAVDFVTVHVLPYWEDEPVAVEQAVEHVFSVYGRVQDAFPQHAILLGETGWPRAGRERHAAVPGRVEQAGFIREFVDAAAVQRLPYNLIEAFDQPWKRRLEGAMGGYWGLFDRDGRAAFPWHGPVRADPRWREGVGAVLAGGFGCGLFAWARGRRRRIPARAPHGRSVLAHALAGASIGGLLIAQWRHAMQWNEDFLSALPAALGAVLTLLYGWLMVERQAATAAFDPQTPGLHTTLFDRLRVAHVFAIRAFDRPGFAPSRAPLVHATNALSLLRFVYLFAAATTLLPLVFDARYRGFPWASFALPLGAALLFALRGERLPSDAREERALCAVIVVGAVLALLLETFSNREALIFLLGMLLYAATWLGVVGRRTSTSSPSSAPSADSPNE